MPDTPPAYCPRCDRPFPTMELMEIHLKKHPDYDPELFDEQD